MPPHVPPPGIYASTITLFNPPKDSIDLNAQSLYFQYLSSRHIGLAGFLVLGTESEASLLTRPERQCLIHCARHSVHRGFPIMAGVSAPSTKQVREYIDDAVQFGANYVVVSPPLGSEPNTGHRGGRGHEEAVHRFFNTIVPYSRLPILICTGHYGGIDLTSEMIAKLVHRHKGKIVGAHLRCGGGGGGGGGSVVGKVTRLAGEFLPSRKEFAIFAGQSDYLVGGLAAGAWGCITAFANVMPWALVWQFHEYVNGDIQNNREKRADALRISGMLAKVEEQVLLDERTGGIAAVKFATSLYTGWRAGVVQGTTGMYPLATEGHMGLELFLPRKPYADVSKERKNKIWKAVNWALDLERDPVADYDLLEKEKAWGLQNGDGGSRKRNIDGYIKR